MKIMTTCAAILLGTLSTHAALLPNEDELKARISMAMSDDFNTKTALAKALAGQDIEAEGVATIIGEAVAAYFHGTPHTVISSTLADGEISPLIISSSSAKQKLLRAILRDDPGAIDALMASGTLNSNPPSR